MAGSGPAAYHIAGGAGQAAYITASERHETTAYFLPYTVPV